MENTMDQTTARIKKHLKALKLSTMEKILDQELARASSEKSPPSTLILRLLDAEAQAARARRIERRIRESALAERKLLADFDFDFQKGIDKSQIMELANLGFVERKQGLILAGSSGTGKSHIAKALLLIACSQLYSCRYTTASNMLSNLMASLCDGTLHHALKVYTRPQVLLIDEIGFDRIEQESARNAALFFKVIDARYCKGSTIATCNINFKELGDYLGDPVITASLVDRMVHHSIIIHIEGPSYRMHESKRLNRAVTKRGKDHGEPTHD
jgi:DNA replication protein DnaC